MWFVFIVSVRRFFFLVLTFNCCSSIQEHLDDENNAKKWYESGYTASERRVLIAQILSKAVARAKENFNFRRVFEKYACTCCYCVFYLADWCTKCPVQCTGSLQNMHVIYRCGALIGPDARFDECIEIDGLPDFKYTRPEGEPEDDWGEGLFVCFSS